MGGLATANGVRVKRIKLSDLDLQILVKYKEQHGAVNAVYQSSSVATPQKGSIPFSKISPQNIQNLADFIGKLKADSQSGTKPVIAQVVTHSHDIVIRFGVPPWDTKSGSPQLNEITPENAKYVGKTIADSRAFAPGSLLMLLGCPSGIVNNSTLSIPAIIAAQGGGKLDVVGTGGFGAPTPLQGQVLGLGGAPGYWFEGPMVFRVTGHIPYASAHLPLPDMGNPNTDPHGWTFRKYLEAANRPRNDVDESENGVFYLYHVEPLGNR